MAPPAPTPGQGECGPGNFRVLSHTKEEEDAYDITAHRDVKFVGKFTSVIHIVKGALGAGLLSGHVAYMKAGAGLAIPFNMFFGSYMCLCFYLLVTSAQTLYRRTRVPQMSYSDIGEAAVACFPNPKIAKHANGFRYVIDILSSVDLFGACACYQIIIAKSIKQLVEGVHVTSIHGTGSYPSLRVYLACMWIPLVLVCLIRHLKWLAPFSLVANIIVLCCVFTTISYAMKNNPGFENLVMATSVYKFFQFIGMNVFSMSCIGVIIPVENSMREPNSFPMVLLIGMTLIVMTTFVQSFFGYVAYLEKCESPITVNFPMILWPKILKGSMAAMIYSTHALNFYTPFNMCFYYIKRRITPERRERWEYFWRAVFVTLVTGIAIVFPNINALMGFIGCLCLSNMIFIWPAIINMLVVWHRPGLGRFKWRLIRSIIIIIIGLFIMILGGVLNGIELYKVVASSF